MATLPHGFIQRLADKRDRAHTEAEIREQITRAGALLLETGQPDGETTDTLGGVRRPGMAR